MSENPINNRKLGSQFESALVYANQLHANQVRKGSNVPYISHLLSVAALVIEDGGTEEEAIAALLHDAIEDQGGAKTREEIRQKFGEKVVAIVNGCTDSEVIPKPPWKERKQRYIDNTSSATLEVRRVSLADKLHNARSILADWYRIGEAVWDKFKGGKQGTLWFYRSFIAAHQQAGYSFLGEELERVVTKIEQVAKSPPTK
jgi:(p)ppGpp synthase/HD superfamily hydrolase